MLEKIKTNKNYLGKLIFMLHLKKTSYLNLEKVREQLPKYNNNGLNDVLYLIFL